MPQTSSYDAIIVGAGPAGATAAYLLASRGNHVVVVDQSIFPREKLCGGLLTYKTLRLHERVFGDTLDLLKEKGIINYIANSYQIRTAGSVLAAGESDYPFILVKRLVYDSYLLGRAREAGTEVIEGDRVIGFDPLKNQVFMASGRSIRGQTILGADGVNSTVRKALPPSKFNEVKWRSNLATALEVFVDRADIKEDISSPIVFFGIIHWGYAWVFPNKDRIAVGVGGLIPNPGSLKDSLSSLLSLIGYRKASLPVVSGHQVPYGNFLTHPAQDQLLLLGDAAGLVDPFMGEGIFYAMQSAEIAADCIQNSGKKGYRLDKEYIRCLRNQILRELIYVRKLRWLLFNVTERVGYRPIKLIVRIIGNRRALEVVQGIRFYRWLKKRKDLV